MSHAAPLPFVTRTRRAVAALGAGILVASGLVLAAPAGAAWSAEEDDDLGNNAEVVVSIGGARTGTGATAVGAPPDGAVHLQLRTGTGGSGNGGAGPSFGSGSLIDECTSVGDTCTFEIVNNNSSSTRDLSDNDNYYWVVQVDEPGRNTPLVLAPDTSNFFATAYQFRTVDIDEGTRYFSGIDFMDEDGANYNLTGNTEDAINGRTGSSGIWQSSFTNPDLPQQCGLDIALVSDLSSSINSSALADLKAAAIDFIEALEGTPSEVSLYTFGTTGPAPNTTGTNNATLSGKSALDADYLSLLTAKINGYAVPSGSYTNWDAGLWQTRSHGHDVVVVITDGNPTAWGVSSTTSPPSTSFNEVEYAVFSANAVKAQGTRIITVGVGSGFLDGENLQAISGPVENTDYFLGDWDTLSETLRQIALATCEGSVTVVKKVIPWDGGIGDATVSSGWTFGGQAPDGITIDDDSQQTGADGAVNFKLGGIPDGQSTTLTVTETQQAGYELEQVGDRNAVCETQSGQSVSVTDVGALGFSLPVGDTSLITCTVYNREDAPDAELTIQKLWSVNGSTPSPTLPEGFSAPDFTVNGDAATAGVAVTVPGGETASIGEGDINLPEGYIAEYCTVSQLVTGFDDGGGVDPVDPPVGLAGSATYTTPELAADSSSTVVVTNSIVCGGELTLTKLVDYGISGDATPETAWTLTATPQGDDNAVITGETGVSGQVEPGTYVVEESGPGETEGYTQVSVECRVGEDGTWEAVDDGEVTVESNQHVFCRITNAAQVPELRLEKFVTDDVVDPDAWHLTATDSGEVVRVEGDGVTDSTPVPVGTYVLAESTTINGADEFTAIWSCTVTSGPNTGPVVLGETQAGEPTVTVGLGQKVYCSVTNAIRALVPEVEKVATGVTANDDGTWDIAYEITVTNPSEVIDLVYTLSDVPSALPTGVEPVSASYSRDGGSTIVVDPTWEGGSFSLTEGGSHTIDADDPDGVSVYSVTLTVAVQPDASEAADACGDQTGIEVDNTVMLTPIGGEALSSDDCVVLNIPEVSHDKTVTSVRQLASGEWEIVYEVEVTAVGDGVALYDLTDAPAFGAGIDLLTASATSAGGQAVVATWNGGLAPTPSVVLADARPITSSGSHVYEIMVTASVAEGVVGSEAANCEIFGNEVGTGFLNESFLTANGESPVVADDCVEPAAPDFEKRLVAPPTNNGDGTVTLVYELIATNSSQVELNYDLDDAIGFAAGVNVLDADVTDSPSGVVLEVPAWDGDANTRIASGVALPAGDGGEHVYEITVVAEPTLFVVESDLECVTDTAGRGYFNGAVLTSGAEEYPGNACADIPTTDLPTLPDPELPTLPLTGVAVSGAVLLGLGLLVVGGIAVTTRRRTARHRL